MRCNPWMGVVLSLFLSSVAYAEVPPITPGILGKNPGDVIAVKKDEEVAAWCNFDKSIVVTSTNVLCVYSGTKRDKGSTIGYS